MDAKHLAVRILGVLTLVVAVIYGFYVLMGFITENFADPWLLASRLLNVAVVVYLAWAGIRMWNWAKGSPMHQPGHVKWGRVLLGALFAFYAIKTQLHPPPGVVDADISLNKVQGQATVAIYIAIAILGMALAVSGIVAKYKRRAPEPILQRRPGVPWP
jgi:hypothetical protein